MTDNPYNKLTSAHLMEQLTSVLDPEFGISIVDLGLIYDIRVADGHVTVDMTFTSMGCPVGAYLLDEVRHVLGAVAGVNSVEVNIVWDPPWSEDRVNPEVRFGLGLY